MLCDASVRQQSCLTPPAFNFLYTTCPRLLPLSSHPQVRSCLDLSVMWRSHHIEQSEQGSVVPNCSRPACMAWGAWPPSVVALLSSAPPEASKTLHLATNTLLLSQASTSRFSPFLGPALCRRQALHGRV